VIWLPPTGLLLLTFLSEGRAKWLRYHTAIFYVASLAIFSWLLADSTPIGLTVCQVVFAKYHEAMLPSLNLAYGILYQLGLISMLFISSVLTVKTGDLFQRKLIGQVLYGCLAFIIPTLVVINVFPITEGAFASILVILLSCWHFFSPA